MGSIGEFYSVTGSPSVQTNIVHTGTYALRVNNPGVATYGSYSIKIAGGTLQAAFRSAKFWLYINAFGAGSTNCMAWSIGASGGAHTTLLRLNSDGTVTLRYNGFQGTSTLTLTTGVWYEIWIDINTDGLTSGVYVNGVLYTNATNGGAEVTAQTEMRVGQGCAAGEGTNWDIVFDDITANDASYSSVGFPPSGSIVKLLILTAGNAANSWTDGAGGTGDIHGSVDNIPPVGVAASTAAAKIKNAASGSNLDYVATMQDYITGGVPSGSTIRAVQAVCNDGEEVGTNTKAGGLWIASNPAQSASTTTFDYGDDGGALGTFPTGWATHFGVVSENPSVTLSTAPTVTVRKVGSTTRVVDVDFMGLQVDYTEPTGVLPRRMLMGAGV